MADAKAPETAAVTVAEGGEAPYSLSLQKQFTDTVVFLGLLFAIFYFMLIRPQQKRLKDHQRLVDAVKKGTRVVTAGGIVGTVAKVEADGLVSVEVAPNVKVQVTKGSIAEILSGDGEKAKTANDN